MKRKELTSTPSWLPPARMTTAKMMTDSMKLKEAGAMVVILAAYRVPAMPAQKAPSTKAMSL